MAAEDDDVIWTLPEDCVANALSLTNPKDACRLSAVAPVFRAAAQSDAVWERFLPSDYRDIISRSDEGCDSFIGRFKSRKEMYLHLCRHPILIEAGLKSFSLEKNSGKKIFMLSARDMSITWTCTPTYWRWTTHPKSRFPEVAELLSVCWFEIRAKINIKALSTNTNYAAYLVYKSKRIYGFDRQTLDGRVGTSEREGQKHKICLDPKGPNLEYHDQGGLFYQRLANILTDNNPCAMPVSEGIRCFKKRRDGWMEVELGEYFVEGGEDCDLEMSLLEIESGMWKSGIVVEGIEIRPKEK